jgi:hypothetical protein
VLKSLADELGPADKAAVSVGEGVTVFVPGVKLRFVFSDPGREANYEQAAQAQLAAYDADKNGYLEKSELPEDQPAGQAAFDDIDTDKDKKLYPKEIAAYAEKQQAPLLKQVHANATGQDDALFSALDASNDGLLGLREMHTAAVRLKSFDADGDGLLSADEVPGSMALSIDRGAARDENAPPAAMAPAVTARPVPAGPPWFVRMDSNVDQDVSLREFLGTPQQFRQVDANGDSFIDPGEAEAAKELKGDTAQSVANENGNPQGTTSTP